MGLRRDLRWGSPYPHGRLRWWGVACPEPRAVGRSVDMEAPEFFGEPIVSHYFAYGI